jgi:hypothetical protein
VGIAAQGPIDSVRTDPRGRFRFSFRPDTAATYLVSTRFAGIEYFSMPLAGRSPTSGTSLDLVVFDTSSQAATRTRSRTLVVSGPDAVGTRTVVDWVVLTNDGRLTRVGRDSLDPTWGMALPANGSNRVIGDPRFSQVSPDAVVFRNDSVLVIAPLSPGDKNVLVQYELPSGQRSLALGVGGIDSVDLYLEEKAARVRSPGWVPGDSQRFQGRTFYRYQRSGPEVSAIELRLPGARIAAGPAMAALVALLALGFVGLTALGWRRRRARPAPAGPPPPDAADGLAERIARLDGAYRGGVAPPAYAEERERLLAELRAALAGRKRPP